jgi:BirA family biotin operon repressor/biotin-[acetyl-CoA-carboxylase] ligase
MKPLAHRVLIHLSDGEFHSGENLARTLAVTRASVWHAVRELEASGLEIYRVRGRGYRLARALSMLDAREISRHLGAAAARFALEIVDSVDSTNTLLMRRAQAGAASATVVAAEAQSAGRGRLGRSWHSGIGDGLTFSLLWRFMQGAGFLAGLSLAVGVALARAFEKMGVEGIGLKWPNDVLWKGRKVAGILIEMQGDALGPSAAVIGIGINVRLSDAVRRRIDQHAADLESAVGRGLDRNAVLAAVLRELLDMLELFERRGFAPLRAQWERRHAFQDRAVTVLLPDGQRAAGIARGAAEDGALIVESSGALRRFHSGEVSVRAAPSFGS